MKVLALDPGAKRMGYAILQRPEGEENKPPNYFGSGVFGLHRDSNESYQEHRIWLLHRCVDVAEDLFNTYQPDEVVNEIVPPVGGSPPNQIQRQLSVTAITVFQTEASRRGIPIRQLAATSVKKAIGGKGKATKVAVRNGVIALIPELERFKKQWTDIFEVPDALAVGLYAMGYSN